MTAREAHTFIVFMASTANARYDLENMSKTNIIFLETEKWEQGYIKERLCLKKELSFNFFKKPLEKVSKKEMATIRMADILAVFIYSAIDKTVLEKFPRLKLIATMPTGFDHIDLNTCQYRPRRLGRN